MLTWFRSADLLVAAANTNGTLILSGILANEESKCARRSRVLRLANVSREEEWVCLTLKKKYDRPAPAVIWCLCLV